MSKDEEGKISSEDDSWVFDSLVNFLHGPIWKGPVLSFLEEKSVVFDPDSFNDMSDEKEDEFKKIFEEYKALVDYILFNFMEDLQVTPEQVEKACRDRENGSSNQSQITKVALEQLAASDDFIIFRRLMTKFNIELQLQSLELLVAKYGVLSPALRSSDSDGESKGDSEDEFLQIVLRYSDPETFFSCLPNNNDKNPSLMLPKGYFAYVSDCEPAPKSKSSGSNYNCQSSIISSLSMPSTSTSNSSKSPSPSPDPDPPSNSTSISSAYKNTSKSKSEKSKSETKSKINHKNKEKEKIDYNSEFSDPQKYALNVHKNPTLILDSNTLSKEEEDKPKELKTKTKAKSKAPAIEKLEIKASINVNKNSEKNEKTEAEKKEIKEISEEHRILSSVRRALDTSGEQPNLSEIQNSQEFSDEEMQKRREYLNSQRDKLVAMKKKEREKHLDGNLSLGGASSSARPKSARAAKMALTSPISTIIDNHDQKCLAARRALAETLKKELIENPTF